MAITYFQVCVISCQINDKQKHDAVDKYREATVFVNSQ